MILVPIIDRKWCNNTHSSNPMPCRRYTKADTMACIVHTSWFAPSIDSGKYLVPHNMTCMYTLHLPSAWMLSSVASPEGGLSIKVPNNCRTRIDRHAQENPRELETWAGWIWPKFWASPFNRISIFVGYTYFPLSDDMCVQVYSHLDVIRDRPHRIPPAASARRNSTHGGVRCIDRCWRHMAAGLSPPLYVCSLFL